MGISLNGRGGGGGGGGGTAADIEVVHDAAIVDPIPILFVTPGSKRSTLPVDVAAVQALTAGVLTIDGVSTPAIDFSGVPDGGNGLAPIRDLVNDQIAATPALDGYKLVSPFIQPSAFYFGIQHFGGNVGALSGNMVPAMGLDTITEEAFSPKTDPIIILPPSSGYWRELRFFSTLTLQTSRTRAQFSATFFSDGTDHASVVQALSNSGAWSAQYNSNTASGLYLVGQAIFYTLEFSDFMYNPNTGEITWDNKYDTVPTQQYGYKMDSLFALGVKGT